MCVNLPNICSLKPRQPFNKFYFDYFSLRQLKPMIVSLSFYNKYILQVIHSAFSQCNLCITVIGLCVVFSLLFKYFCWICYNMSNISNCSAIWDTRQTKLETWLKAIICLCQPKTVLLTYNMTQQHNARSQTRYWAKYLIILYVSRYVKMHLQ